MKALKTIALVAICACLLLAPKAWNQTSPAQQASKAPPGKVPSLVGTWTLISETAHQGDKTSQPLGSSQPLGPNPQGMMMFDSNGRFMMIIARPDIPKFAINRRDAGTPEENKAVLAGMLGFFGTYSVSDVDQVLTIRPEASTFPNWNGADQKRSLTFRGDEMIWTNRAPAVGADIVEVVWKRSR